MRTLIADCTSFTLGVAIVVNEHGKPVATARATISELPRKIVHIAANHEVDTIYLLGNLSFTRKFKKEIEEMCNIKIVLLEGGYINE